MPWAKGLWEGTPGATVFTAINEGGKEEAIMDLYISSLGWQKFLYSPVLAIIQVHTLFNGYFLWFI
jgi:hypothetical protein